MFLWNYLAAPDSMNLQWQQNLHYNLEFYSGHGSRVVAAQHDGANYWIFKRFWNLYLCFIKKYSIFIAVSISGRSSKYLRTLSESVCCAVSKPIKVLEVLTVQWFQSWNCGGSQTGSWFGYLQLSCKMMQRFFWKPNPIYNYHFCTALELQ